LGNQFKAEKRRNEKNGEETRKKKDKITKWKLHIQVLVRTAIIFFKAGPPQSCEAERSEKDPPPLPTNSENVLVS
jgi:hypothetical protein